MATETTFESRTNHSSPDANLSGRWRVISERSRVGFRVKKMGLYHVKGRFRAVAGTVELGPGESSAEIVIDASSVTTRMPPRDLHLRSADFLDVKTHPVIAVSTGAVEGGPDGELRVPATFEIRGRRAAAPGRDHRVPGLFGVGAGMPAPAQHPTWPQLRQTRSVRSMPHSSQASARGLASRSMSRRCSHSSPG